MATVVMFVDGVLRSHTGSPIYQGIAIYRLFNEGNRVILLCADRDKDDNWLKQHKINKLDDLIGRDIPAMTKDNQEFRQVEYCLGKGAVELVVTSDPELARKLLVAGLTTMVFMQPSYIKEDFRPDSKVGVKSWSAIVDEIVKQQETFVEDPRVKE